MSEFDEAGREAAGGFAQRSPTSDLICTIPWVGHGFHAIEVYADPSLLDRAEELCGTVGSWAATSDDADSMVSTVLAYSGSEEINASILDDPEDPVSGVIGIAFTA